MGPSWCLPSFSCAAASERPQSFSLSPALTAQLWGAEGGGTEGHCDRHKCIHAASSSLKMDFFQPPFLSPPFPPRRLRRVVRSAFCIAAFTGRSWPGAFRAASQREKKLNWQRCSAGAGAPGWGGGKRPLADGGGSRRVGEG